MPLLRGKGQRVFGDLIEMLVIVRQGANALNIDDELSGHRLGEGCDGFSEDLTRP